MQLYFILLFIFELIRYFRKFICIISRIRHLMVNHPVSICVNTQNTLKIGFSFIIIGFYNLLPHLNFRRWPTDGY